MRRWAAAIAVVAAVGCGSSGDGAGSSASPTSSPATSASARGPAVARAICDASTTEERACFEMQDDDLIRDRQTACAGDLASDKACPRERIVGTCRLPDGSVRFGYPPKSEAAHEKVCKELQGTFAAGAVAPPVDGPRFVSCDGKYEATCEEEEVYAAPRLARFEDQCRTFGGKFRSMRCPTEGARFACDLRGKRTIVSRLVTSPVAAERFCTERSGVYRDLTPAPAASASASASASVAVPVDPDPPAEKPDFIIRQQ